MLRAIMSVAQATSEALCDTLGGVNSKVINDKENEYGCLIRILSYSRKLASSSSLLNSHKSTWYFSE